MVDSINNSLISLGDCGPAANTLIEKVSNAVGAVFEPWQIKRVAKAQAEADITKAATEIQISGLQRRAMRRFLDEEARRQQNIEDITAKALPQLDQGTDASGMEDDWVTNFFDKCRIISNEEMQQVWSRVLAGEANAPGSYSKRTVNFLAELDKSDAEQFAKLTSFGWSKENGIPLIFDPTAPIYTNNGITTGTLRHLQSIGLIDFQAIGALQLKDQAMPVKFEYFGRFLRVHPTKDNNTISLGKVSLTQIGLQLAPISGAKQIDGVFDYVKKQWATLKAEEIPPS